MAQIASLIVSLCISSAAAHGSGSAMWQNCGPTPQERHYLIETRTHLWTTPKGNSAQPPRSVTPEDSEMSDTVIYVSNLADLYQAIKAATGGEIIELAPGDYGQLDLLSTKTFGVSAVFDDTVTIRSADNDNPASFSGMQLHGAQNLTIDGVVFDSNFSGTAVWAEQFNIRDSTGITIQNSLFQGELITGTGDPALDGYATGKGLAITGSSDISIIGNEFSTFHRGLVVASCSNVSIIGNDIHSLRSDGLDFVQVQSVLIEDNYIHDFATSPLSGDHPDMIQFWTNGSTRPSTDITIRGNTLDVGSGATTQSIFMRNDLVDRGLAGAEMFYQNIFIEENIILNNHTHGITVGETAGLTIRNNTVLDADSSIVDTVRTPKISVAPLSTSVFIGSNVVASVGGYTGQLDWSVPGNLLVQNTDITSSNHYEYVFLSSSMSGSAVGYIVNPESAIADQRAGATRLLFEQTPDHLRPVFSLSEDVDHKNLFVFDARWSAGPEGSYNPDSAEFVWDFGDGTISRGIVAAHTYQSAGLYNAILTITLPDGTSSQARSLVGVVGSDMLDFNPYSGVFEYQSYGETVEIDGSDRATVSFGEKNGIDIGDVGSQLTIDKKIIARLFGADGFDLSMSLRADTLGSYGEILRVHNNFVLTAQKDGNLLFELWTDAGYKSVTTSGVRVTDLAEHEIQISFDGAASSLLVYVDGNISGSALAEGSLRSDFPNALVFGNPWGKLNFDATVTSFGIDVSKPSYPEFVGEVENFLSLSNATDGDVAVGLTEIPIDSSDQIEIFGVHLDLSGLDDGTFGKLMGDAFVDYGRSVPAVVLDGLSDSIRLSAPQNLQITSELSFGLVFESFGDLSSARTLVSKNNSFSIMIRDDAIMLELHQASSGNKASTIVADALGVGSGEPHSLLLMADSHTDRVQVLIDDILIIDTSDVPIDDFDSSSKKNWWSLDFVVGDGGRRSSDFQGAVSDIWIDDQAMFVNI